MATKEAVHAFFTKASCGEALLLPDTTPDGYQQQARTRYQWEPQIPGFAEFERWAGKRVLEVGVGLGAEHEQFAKAGAIMTGIDLTSRAIEHTQRRLGYRGVNSDLRVADAEELPFAEGSFDLVYSWGVILNCPNIQRAVDEIYRVVRAGGQARVMIYHKWSIVGYMLWTRYAFLQLRPWLSLRYIYANYLENYGTQAFTRAKAQYLFRKFQTVNVTVELCHGDLLTSRAGQRHEGLLLDIARVIWPRWFIRRFLKRHGLFMMIRAEK